MNEKSEISTFDDRMNSEHNYPGKLFVLEGIDGSGKTTQLTLLQKWLESKGYAVNYTRRRTSKLVSRTIEKAKANKTLNPVTYCLIHASDFADRLENDIIPALRAGIFILADKYIYTSFVRDAAMGNDLEWVKKIYGFAIKPDAVVYLDLPVEEAIERIKGTNKLGQYQAGLQYDFHPDPVQSFRIFQSKVYKEYQKLWEEHECLIIDATTPIHKQQNQLRQYIGSILSLSGTSVTED